MASRRQRVAADLGASLSMALIDPPWLSPERSIQTNVNLLVAHLGSGRAAGRALGVPETTIRSWRKGVVPRDPAKASLVISAGRRAIVGKTFHDAYRGTTELVILGDVEVSNDSRVRKIRPGAYIPRSTIRRALNHWLNGDDIKAGATLGRAIDTYYTPLQFAPGTPVVMEFE